MIVSAKWLKLLEHWKISEEDENGNVISSSHDPKFPVDPFEFGKDESDKLIDALCEAFPNHGIFVTGSEFEND